MESADKARWIVDQAKAIGFDLCGVARAETWPELEHLPEWLARGYAGEMNYLADSRRGSPLSAFANARSVIVAALNYNSLRPRSGGRPSRPINSAPAQDDPARGWISRYAWGDDYHDVLGKKLAALLAAMRAEFSDSFDARWYVDTGPILERVAAKYAGLGWLAKNTCLINERLGSWLFLGVIVTTLELAPALAPGESPPADRCGSCTLCLDACPTAAFPAPYVMDARRCISYLTIELRGAIPEELRPATRSHVIGCDICQDVCPWNRKSPLAQIPGFQPRTFPVANISAEGETREETLFEPDLAWLAGLTQAEFSAVFRNSAVKRAKWRGLVRNACVALGNAAWNRGTPSFARAASLLEGLAASDDAVIAEHARWALGRLAAAAAR
ncbi:MAG TPA: tRNA epoxyqueuosine(34) reductase QueG [Verrucomicrobiae bacterium]|nr:tRNA epoxyqueuosine(34) reductase QueG [Verrucomicrobiae bacterium]